MSCTFRWVVAGAGEPDDSNSTLVVFTLTPEDDGTRLRVVESGFASLDISDEQRAQRVEENIGGWRSELDELRDYVSAAAA